jgi:hypothetical protein
MKVNTKRLIGLFITGLAYFAFSLQILPAIAGVEDVCLRTALFVGWLILGCVGLAPLTPFPSCNDDSKS